MENLKIQYFDIDKIKPYENNPRNNDETIQYLVNSINEFGFKVPIVIDKNNVIVAGHARYKACQELNMKQIPCVVIDDLTDKQIMAYRIADNKVTERSEWDWDKLTEELADIESIDMSEFGFEKFSKGDLLDNFDLTYIANYKIYVKSKNVYDIELAKQIVGELNGDN